MSRWVELSQSAADPAQDSVDPELSCITCGDVAFEARVVGFHRGNALVERAGRIEAVAVELVDVVVSDVVLCHAGVALEKLDRAPREIVDEGR